MSLSDQVVTEEKCEEEYVVELKEECEYSTVQDKVCSQGYSPSYSDQVQSKTRFQESLKMEHFFNS